MYHRHQIADLADGQLLKTLKMAEARAYVNLCMQALTLRRSNRGTKMYRGKRCGDEKTFLLVFGVCNGWADKHGMAFEDPRTRGWSSTVKTKSA